ncbi:MAG: hypothetical protein ACO1N7_02070 [Sphingobacteriaceae bacterium]
MNLTQFKACFLAVAISFAACNNVENKSTNPFANLSSNSKEYKDKLAQKLRSNPEDISYFVNRYLERSGNAYLDVKVKGSDFEATGLVLVNSWDKLEGIQRTKGMGYSGAELEGLQLDIRESKTGAEFIYKDVDQIVD